MNERNKRAYEEIDVKGVTQSKISKRYYIPNKYLKPFEEG
jgi:LysM repeat protein